MKLIVILITSLLISLAVFLLFSWPLPKYLTTGIPAQGNNPEGHEARNMIHGDHLQFMYRMWLGGDYLASKTPLFHNLYEFNTGNDSERYMFHVLHFPYPLIFKIGDKWLNRAMGWNLMFFITIWISYFFTYLLLRQFNIDKFYAAWAALFPIIFPFKWLTTCAGSPTGFGLAWTPMLFLGMVLAMQDPMFLKRILGGCLAGVAMLFISFCDLHVFYFTLLFGPVIFLICILLSHESLSYLSFSRKIQSWMFSLFPLVVGTLLGILYSLYGKRTISQAPEKGVKSMEEVFIYSPNWLDYFFFTGTHVYIGIACCTALVLALIFILYRLFEGELSLMQMGIISCLFVLIIVPLSLGFGIDPHIKHSPFLVARNYIPMFDMIRQPPKVFVYIPLVFALLFGIVFQEIRYKFNNRFLVYILPILLMSYLIFDYSHRLNPKICLLKNEQKAYESVAIDSRSRAEEPHALAVPFWPGSDAWSSLYLYYASLYRIRLANGYNPAPKASYVNDFYSRFSSINQGYLDAFQLDELLRRNIKYVLFHEDVWIEKISPFPVGHTLISLLNNPRLKLITQDQGVWSFEILLENRKNVQRIQELPGYFPSRHLEMEHVSFRHCEKNLKVTTASRGGMITLTGRTSKVIFKKCQVVPDTRLSWRMRLRGEGQFKAILRMDQQIIFSRLLSLNSPKWIWKDISLKWLKEPGRITLFLYGDTGRIDLDCAYLAKGSPPVLAPGDTLRYPASCFFHTGGINNLKKQSLLFRPAFVKNGKIFHGFNMPLPIGNYDFELKYNSPAPEGLELFNFYATSNEQLIRHHEVIQGRKAAFEMPVENNFPIKLFIHYLPKAELEIQELLIKRK